MEETRVIYRAASSRRMVETMINNEDSRGYIPVGPPAPGLSSVTTLSSSLLDSPLSRRSRSGLLAITEVLFDGIGNDGFGRPCIAAKACCTASWRTSVHSESNDQANQLANFLQRVDHSLLRCEKDTREKSREPSGATRRRAFT